MIIVRSKHASIEKPERCVQCATMHAIQKEKERDRVCVYAEKKITKYLDTRENESFILECTFTSIWCVRATSLEIS